MQLNKQLHTQYKKNKQGKKRSRLLGSLDNERKNSCCWYALCRSGGVSIVAVLLPQLRDMVGKWGRTRKEKKKQQLLSNAYS